MIHPKLTNLALAAVAVIAVGLLPYTTTYAEQTSQIAISPVTFELTANPGDKLENAINVTNRSDSTLQLETRVENIAGTGEEGEPYLSEESTTYSLSQWVKTSPANFSLEQGKTRPVSFTIEVPKTAEPGGHYGSILIGTVASNSKTTGTSVAQRVGAIVLVRVSGQAKEDAEITSFKFKKYSGQWDDITASDGVHHVLIPKDDTSKLPASKYFDKGPIAIEVMVHNSGNVHVKPTGYVTIRNLFGQKVAEITLDPRNVFPGDDRRLAMVWPQKNLWGGYYRVQLNAVYGSSSGSNTLTYDSSFWAFPWWAALVIVLSLLVLIFARRRIKRVLQVLIKG